MLRNTQLIRRDVDLTPPLSWSSRNKFLKAEEHALHVEFFRHVCRTSIECGESTPDVARDQYEVRIGDVGAAHVEPLHDFVIPC